MKYFPRPCTRCGVPKAWADYSPAKKPVDGRAAECKPCFAARRRASYKGTEPRSERATKNALRHVKVRNDETRVTARHAGRVWTSTELGLVARDDYDPMRLSRELGRSYASVVRMRHRVLTDPRKARLAEV